jgi:hypothetical protein
LSGCPFRDLLSRVGVPGLPLRFRHQERLAPVRLLPPLLCPPFPAQGRINGNTPLHDSTSWRSVRLASLAPLQESPPSGSTLVTFSRSETYLRVTARSVRSPMPSDLHLPAPDHRSRFVPFRVARCRGTRISPGTRRILCSSAGIPLFLPADHPGTGRYTPVHLSGPVIPGVFTGHRLFAV